MEKSISRYSGIDVMKFICSLMIVIIHVKPFGVHEAGSFLYYLNFGLQEYLCRIAVPFFFVCNGFFIFRKIDFNNVDYGIIKNNIIKIIKLYLLWTLIYLPIKIYKMFTEGEGLVREVVSYIRAFLVSGSFVHLWYLNGLIFALLAIMIFLKLKLNPQKILVLSAILYIIGLLGNSYFGLISKNPNIVLSLYELYFKLFINTRNGLLCGLLFISIGMMISVKKPSAPIKKNAILFCASMLFMLAEVYMLKHFSLAKDYDATVMVVPAVYFLFCTVSKMNILEKISPLLREMSKTIYYVHLWVSFVIEEIMKHLPEFLKKTPFMFVTVTIITLVIAFAAAKISAKRKENVIYSSLQK